VSELDEVDHLAISLSKLEINPSSREDVSPMSTSPMVLLILSKIKYLVVKAEFTTPELNRA
jgi:hypothetical protein